MIAEWSVRQTWSRSHEVQGLAEPGSVLDECRALNQTQRCQNRTAKHTEAVTAYASASAQELMTQEFAGPSTRQ